MLYSLTTWKAKMLGQRDAGVLAYYSPEEVNYGTLMDSVLKQEHNGVPSNGHRNWCRGRRAWFQNCGSQHSGLLRSTVPCGRNGRPSFSPSTFMLNIAHSALGLCRVVIWASTCKCATLSSVFTRWNVMWFLWWDGGEIKCFIRLHKSIMFSLFDDDDDDDDDDDCAVKFARK
jgi:hypothetical protein